ncbi:MAG: transporter substrate-binding domain-containing protein, partial [Candidatus Marinimicrobia bacterium]|nr:transporter substrate-binding domain-containing protein [Candidatus Neomarinimicrobiota bacterium]
MGIYQNPPKVFLDNKNIPQGIFVDIMNEIARVEKWEIEYIFDTWENNLLALKEGRLDIVLDVSYTKKREEIFTFNRVPILDTWLQVFTTRDKIIDSIDGLRNKRIGVLKGSRQEVYLIEEFPQWVDIPYTLKAYSDYPATINALKSGEIDFLVATRFFYFTLDPSDVIVSTPVIFSPTDVYFAFQKDGENPLIFVIDSHLNLMKNDPHSVYYQSLNRLFSTQERFYIPPLIRIILLI